MARTITVEGMGCEGCERTVVDALKGVDGVEDASADRTTDSATVEGNAALKALLAAVSEAGYTASA